MNDMATGGAAAKSDLRLDRLAEVAVRVGLGLKPGQELVMTAPLEALPLARLITDHAYRAGASLVTTILNDDAMTLSRFRHGRDAAFDAAPGWLYEGMASAYRAGSGDRDLHDFSYGLWSKDLVRDWWAMRAELSRTPEPRRRQLCALPRGCR